MTHLLSNLYQVTNPRHNDHNPIIREQFPPIISPPPPNSKRSNRVETRTASARGASALYIPSPPRRLAALGGGAQRWRRRWRHCAVAWQRRCKSQHEHRWKATGSVRVPYNGVTGREEMHARAVPAKLPLLSLTRARRLTLSSSLSTPFSYPSPPRRSDRGPVCKSPISVPLILCLLSDSLFRLAVRGNSRDRSCDVTDQEREMVMVLFRERSNESLWCFTGYRMIEDNFRIKGSVSFEWIWRFFYVYATILFLLRDEMNLCGIGRRIR